LKIKVNKSSQTTRLHETLITIMGTKLLLFYKTVNKNLCRSLAVIKQCRLWSCLILICRDLHRCNVLPCISPFFCSAVLIATKIKHLPDVGAWRQTNVWLRTRLSFSTTIWRLVWL